MGKGILEPMYINQMGLNMGGNLHKVFNVHTETWLVFLPGN